MPSASSSSSAPPVDDNSVPLMFNWGGEVYGRYPDNGLSPDCSQRNRTTLGVQDSPREASGGQSFLNGSYSCCTRHAGKVTNGAWHQGSLDSNPAGEAGKWCKASGA